MKPAAVVLVLSLGTLACGAPALAQKPWQLAAPLEQTPLLAVGDHFEPCPAPWSPRLPADNPDAFLWSDYRGAYIEHDLYRPRYLDSSACDTLHSRPMLSSLGDWLDGLFSWLPAHRKHACQHCVPAITTYGSNNPAPFAPARPDGHAFPPEAPLVAPVPAADREPTLPSAEPAPFQPSPGPRVQTERLPTNEIPPRLIPPRSPVVELAPEPALPVEPPAAPTLPRNRVPRPGQQLPRNVVPR